MSCIELDERAWQAVLDRDRNHDGAFVYAVVTTGVYCRPTCPSRRPRRQNVRFYPTAAEAEREGFRACKRCRPDDADGAPADEAVATVLAWLRAHDGQEATLERLASVAGLSPSHLQRRFKACTGLSPREYVHARRIARFRERVADGDDVTRATYAAGFGSSRGLYASARTDLGMTPGAYARRGAGLDVNWTVETCSLGRVLVASTADGVCAVLLGEDDETLRDQLRAQLGAAQLSSDPGVRVDWTRNVLRHLDDTRMPLGVPLDYRGTPFQIRVWKALRQIPRGETRTYGQVAEAVGSPSAVRAVGSACARNAIAVLVPCHRVIRKDGTLGGYRWGLERKGALLETETAKR